jgi:hypothetical protein
MNNIISIRNRISASPKFDLGMPGWSFDWTFYLGVTLTVVLPRIILGSYYGVLALFLVGTAAILAAGIGLHHYKHAPDLPPSCVPPNVQQSSASEQANLKLVA